MTEIPTKAKLQEITQADDAISPENTRYIPGYCTTHCGNPFPIEDSKTGNIVPIISVRIEQDEVEQKVG